MVTNDFKRLSQLQPGLGVFGLEDLPNDVDVWRTIKGGLQPAVPEDCLSGLTSEREDRLWCRKMSEMR